MEVGGLARTDQAGYGGEFESLVALAGGRADAPSEASIPETQKAAAQTATLPPETQTVEPRKDGTT
jgi:hypothetical protein